MYCPKCGRIIDDDSKYCDYCGTKVLQVNTLKKEPQITDASLQKTTPQPEAPAPEAPKKSSSKRKWLGILGIILVMIGIGVGAFIAVDRASARKEEARALAILHGWIDLGLPSGTLWKDYNEEGFYTYDEAVEQFGDNLPSKEQLSELSDRCKWTWTGDGYQVEGPNGNHIFLPAAGYHDSSCGVGVNYVGSGGGYWSSTPYGSEDAWRLYFISEGVSMDYYNSCDGLSVRLVSFLE